MSSIEALINRQFKKWEGERKSSQVARERDAVAEWAAEHAAELPYKVENDG